MSCVLYGLPSQFSRFDLWNFIEENIPVTFNPTCDMPTWLLSSKKCSHLIDLKENNLLRCRLLSLVYHTGYKFTGGLHLSQSAIQIVYMKAMLSISCYTLRSWNNQCIGLFFSKTTPKVVAPLIVIELSKAVAWKWLLDLARSACRNIFTARRHKYPWMHYIDYV